MQVVALGGATEVTVWSNFFVVDAVDPRWRSVPYGRPMWNHQYYSLGVDGNPVHFGMPGDLFIGGIGVLGAKLWKLFSNFRCVFFSVF